MRRSGLFLVLLLASAPDTVMAEAPRPPRVESGPVVRVYKGKMVDEAGKPVSGIYPMSFKLYRQGSKKPIWKEDMWVAVDRGSYAVTLGERTPLPSGAATAEGLDIGVTIRGVGEVVREEFSAATVTGGGTGPARHQASQKYADTAGYAVEADHAKNADRLQNMTLEELTARLLEAIAAQLGGKVGGKTTVSAKKRPGARFGGPGGSEFEDSCPKGYVMTGLKGGAATFVDSVQIVCSPLE